MMINSRSINELHPKVQAKARNFLTVCEVEGIDILITSTYRDYESQNALYAQGRTLPGKKVTNAKGGQSFHNFRVAFDVVPLRYGKPVWGTKLKDDLDLWKRIGAIGKRVGLEWAGDWINFKEFAHFQYTEGLTLTELQNGKALT